MNEKFPARRSILCLCDLQVSDKFLQIRELFLPVVLRRIKHYRVNVLLGIEIIVPSHITRRLGFYRLAVGVVGVFNKIISNHFIIIVYRVKTAYRCFNGVAELRVRRIVRDIGYNDAGAGAFRPCGKVGKILRIVTRADNYL